MIEITVQVIKPTYSLAKQITSVTSDSAFNSQENEVANSA